MNCYSVFISFFKSTKPQVKVDWAADRPLVHLIPVLTARENSRKNPDGQSDSPALPGLSGSSRSGQVLGTLVYGRRAPLAGSQRAGKAEARPT